MAITTGAPLPPGTEAVVPVEAARRTDDVVLVASPPLLGSGIRRAGEELRTGDVLVLPGTLAQPRTLERLAAQGVTQLPVSRRGHVHLIATGDELVPPGQAPGLGERVASNLPMLEALVRAAGGYLERSVVIPDDPGQLREALAEAANGDLLLTVGGTLHGSKDLTKAALCRPLLRALHGWVSPLPAFRARLAEPLPPAGEETLLVAGVVQETAARLEFHRRGQGWPALGMLEPCPAGSDPDPHITVEPFPLE